MTTILTLALAALPALQEAAADTTSDTPTVPIGPPAAADATTPSSASTTAEALRGRIHQMRMDLLLGGDLVRQAETEAIGFYERKADFVDRRMDTLGSDLSERRTAYEVVLDRALVSESGAARLRALEEAQPLRKEISVLEAERESLGEKRERISQLIASVASRERDREKLVELVESTEAVPDTLGLPWTGIGLAPASAPVEPTSLLEDDALLTDLFARDPVGARRLVFDADPVGYWEVFPLQPPADALRAALVLPLPDLPGYR